MDDPIAFFLTIATYGTWLPGDERGWVEYHQGWKLPSPPLELECQAKMSEDACILRSGQRLIVERQLAETCEHRSWVLHAKNCRSNHMHAVVGAHDVPPRKIRQDLKAWCTRKLKATSDERRSNWWAERGSIRWVFTDDQLEQVTAYVADAQDRKRFQS